MRSKLLTVCETVMQQAGAGRCTQEDPGMDALWYAWPTRQLHNQPGPLRCSIGGRGW
jgi:hypothetical protein